MDKENQGILNSLIDPVCEKIESTLIKKGKKYSKKALKKVVAKVLVRAIPKFTAKCAAKKIPVAGLVAGGIFAIGKLCYGDWQGAGRQMASGAASCVPGVGTVASLGIDAISLAIELQEEVECELVKEGC